jgi:hypothetical protein
MALVAYDLTARKARAKVPVQVRRARMHARYPDMELVQFRDGRVEVMQRRPVTPGSNVMHTFTLKRCERPPAWRDLPLRVNKATRWCAVCGDEHVQRHHWLPVAVAQRYGEDANAWPSSYLCPDHHQLWHKVMHEAGLAGRLRVGKRGGHNATSAV